MTTRAYLLHPDLGDAKGRAAEEAFAEGQALVRAIAVEPVGAEIVRIARPNPATLFGRGRVAQLAEALRAREVELVIVNGALTPVQQRNLERAWNVKVLDRTGLILEIFGERARTREGVLQVSLAHLSYQKSRLVRSWTHLERQRGATGFIGGPGERQIEADRRALDEQITRLRRQLEKVRRTRSLHRAARKKVPHPVVALVGYTNAGKSTLFNRLAAAEVVVADQLFATLDPTMRRIHLPSGRTAILSDTVGFISDLPVELVAAFRATLEEVLEADVIVHVRNVAHPESDEQNRDVLEVLGELGVGEARQQAMIEFLNKVDLLAPPEAEAVRNLAARSPNAVVGSALEGTGTDDLLAAIEERLFPRRMLLTLRLGHDGGSAISWLYSHGEVRERADDERGTDLTVEMTEKEYFQFRKDFGDVAHEVRRRALAAQ